MAGGGQACNSPGGAVRFAHHGGVQFIAARGGEDGAAASVEQRVVLHDFDRRLHGIHRGSAGGEDGLPGLKRAMQGGAIRRILFRRQAVALDDPGAAVDGQRPCRRVLRDDGRREERQGGGEQGGAMRFHGLQPRPCAGRTQGLD